MPTPRFRICRRPDETDGEGETPPRFYMDIETRHGIKTSTTISDGKLIVNKKQDITHDIEYATLLRNQPDYTANGIKKGWMHAAHIPDVVYVDLLKHGVDCLRAPAKEIVAALKKYGYDYLLTTNARI